MTRADVDAILGPRFTRRKDPEAAVPTLVVRPPTDMTQDDNDRLAELEARRPVTMAIRIEGSPYR